MEQKTFFLIGINKFYSSVFSLLLFIVILFNFNACSSNDNPDSNSFAVVNSVKPINELYKNLDFTAIAAHRCYYRKSPENSLSAIDDAIILGIEFLESDTQTTADGVVILFHDSTLDRITNGTGKIAKKNYSAINGLKLKNRNGDLSSESIATLEQALHKIKGENIYMHIEVKDKKFSEVIKVIKKLEMENQVIVFADTRDDYDTLDTFVGIFIDAVCRNSEQFNFYLNRANTPLLNLAGVEFNSNNTLTAKNKNKLTWRGITNKDEDNELLKSSTNKPHLEAVLQVEPTIIHTDYADLLLTYLKSKNKRK